MGGEALTPTNWLSARCGNHGKGMLTVCGGVGGRDHRGRLQRETRGVQPDADLSGS